MHGSVDSTEPDDSGIGGYNPGKFLHFFPGKAFAGIGGQYLAGLLIRLQKVLSAPLDPWPDFLKITFIMEAFYNGRTKFQRGQNHLKENRITLVDSFQIQPGAPAYMRIMAFSCFDIHSYIV